MNRKKIQNDQSYSYVSPHKNFSIKGKVFSTRNFIQDFSFNNQEFHQAKWINKIFGNSKFINAFFRLLLPSIFWGLFTALVPILFNTMINGIYGDGSIGNELANAVNWTPLLFTYFNPLIGSFLFAAFPAIGNYIGKGDKKKLQEVLRWAIYLSCFFCVIGLILEQVFAAQIANVLVWGNSGQLTTYEVWGNDYSISLIRWLAFSGFFYIWLWIYVPSLPSMKNSRILFISSAVGFVYFIIAYPSYLHATVIDVTGQKNPTYNEFLHFNSMMNGIGGIYLGFYIIQPLFLFIYTIFPRHFKLFEAKCANFFINIWNAINRSYYAYQHSTRKKQQKFPKLYEVRPTELEDYSDQERDLLFFSTGFNVTFKRLKQLLLLSWVILIDQVIYAILNIILLTVTINYGGYWDAWNGIKAATDKDSLHMAKDYYKQIFFCVSLISTYIWTIYNGFSLLPQYFVAYYLGYNDKETAYHNSTILTNWSIVFGLFLAIVVIIYGCFINKIEYASSSPTNVYTYNGYILGTYAQLWADQFNMELIYALAVFFDTAVAMTYYVLVSGGSKFVIFADSLVQIINTAASLALYKTHYSDFYVYYLVNRMHTFLKFIIGFAIIYAGGALWGMDSKHDKKGWFKQKIITYVTIPAIEEIQ